MAEVRLEFELAHPPERVWRALTDAKLLGEWFMPNDLEPTEGARFTLDPGTLPGFLGTVTGEVAELVAPRRLVMLWQGDKLHTKVSWELSPHDRGCVLRVIQTGFIGAPAAIRQRALRATYGQLFEQRLPAALDRLATGALDWGGQPVASSTPQRQSARREAAASPSADPAGPVVPAAAASASEVSVDPAVRPAAPVVPVAAASASEVSVDPAVRAAAPAVPKQRNPTANLPLAAWSAGRRMAVGGGEPAADPGARRAKPASAPEPERTPSPAATSASRTPPPRQAEAAESGPSRRRSLLVPPWVRAVTVAGSAAVLVLLVLAVVVWTSGPGPGFGGGSGGDERDQGPGAALQPGVVVPSDAAPGGSGGVSPGAVPGESAGPGPGDSGAPGQQPGVDPSGWPTGRPPQGTPVPQPTQPSDPPELTATYTTSGGGLLGLGSRSVTVTVSNPGPGNATGWEVAMDVGGQDVTNVSGANHRQDGSLAIFTPLEPGPAAGGSVTFSYEIGGVLADDPSSCSIDGRPCA